MSQDTGVKTVDKIVEILDCFTREKSTWSLRDLSAHLKIPKSSLHRILLSLEYYGILRRSADEGNWALGYRLFIWGVHVSQANAYQQIARPYLRELVSATGETAALMVYDNMEVICIDKIDSSYALRLTLEVGHRQPPYAGAPSKILMAYLPEAEIHAIIAKGLRQITEHTVTDPGQLLAQLADIRREGFAFSCEEIDPGAWGLAVPISDSKGSVVAAVGLAGPVHRLTENIVPQYTALCRQTAEKIEAVLRGAPLDGNSALISP